jgi:hypothetical protein
MKAEFLKLAGVKSEKAFYKKYPTEAAFFKAHPEAKKKVKKAQYGGVMDGLSDYLQSMNNPVPDMSNIIQGQMQSPGVNANMFSSASQPSVGPQQKVSGPTFSPGNYNSWDIDNNGVPDTIQKPEGNPLNNNGMQSQAAAAAKPSFGDQVAKYAGPAGQLISGFQNLKAGKKAKEEAQMWAAVTGVQADAAESVDVDDLRQYFDNSKRRRNAMMPVITGEEFFPIYGRGSNVLRNSRNGIRLQDGGMVDGNPTEIQNTYDEGTDIYTNLEYEPLYDIDQIKSYRMGGHLPKAFTGDDVSGMMSSMGGAGGGTPWGAIGGFGSQAAGSLTGNDGGGQIGGAIGGAAGFAIGGPAGQAIGQTLGTLAGGLLDTNDREERKAKQEQEWNIGRMISAQFSGDYLHPKYGANLRNGGYMNPEYNPQVITMFGDVNDQDFADYAHKDQFRAGGHLKAYTPPSERAMETYAMGGEVETTWGGYAEPISHNPYLPGTGQTVMFRGQSHDERDSKGRTGIGVKYGQPDSYTDYAEYGSEVDADVEVERNEPATELQNANGEKNLTVYGNLMIPKYGVEALEDKNAKGKKFKNYVADLSKIEEQQTKMIDKSTNELDALDIRSSFDKLKFNALEANIKGGNLKLKEIADKKVKAADLQNAINETAEEYGLIADDLARGKVKVDKKAMKEYAKFGKSIPKAQYGLEVWEGNKTGLGKKTASEFTLDQWNQVAKKYGFKGQGNLEFQKFLMTNPETSKIIKARHNMLYGKNPETDPSLYDAKLGRGYAAAELLELPPAATIPVDKTAKGDNTKKEDANFETVPYKRSGLVDALGQILPYIRPTDQEDLSPNQLLGETYALSNNQVEPVQAIPVNPRLRVPYEINRNAAKNDLIAQVRAAQRMVQGNPAAQAYIAAQAYGPMQQLNEKDFIDNQAMRDAVYSGNIATLNDADAKNREIYDRQYARQSQARSNTKATAQAALNSISDKYSKNRLENKTLGIYENLYNYRYDKMGRAINMNAPFQPNIPYIYDKHGRITHKIVYDKNGKMLGYEPYSKGEELFLQETDENYVPIPEDGTTPIPSLSTGPIVPQGSFAPTGYVPIDEEEYTNQEYMDQVAPKKFGGKVNKKYSQSSIVRAFK